MSAFEKNTILYGPPGTGKTYNTVLYAVAIIKGKTVDAVRGENYTEVLKRYNTYRENGLIEFATFHQSYGYEEFVEGIKPVVSKPADVKDAANAGDVQYEIKPGVFKEFCTDSFYSHIVNPNAKVWRIVMGNNERIFNQCKNSGAIRMSMNGGSRATADSPEPVKLFADIDNNGIKVGDIVLATYRQNKIFAVGYVTGTYEFETNANNDYSHMRNVRWLTPSNFEEDTQEISFGIQNLLKKIDNIEIGDVVGNDDVNIEAVRSEFKQILKRVNTPKVFIIDEINRGNISKIFGELITLTEDTKRIGQPEECKVKLPYSGELFGIPDNVYILGTMNTADRSIAAMDTALRRRFEFVEMLPDTEALEDITVGGINIGKMLEVMNERITMLYDREHTIGHAYLLPLRKSPSVEKLADIFKRRIIPLLQEYFYDDYEKISLVLGDNGFIMLSKPNQKLFGKNTDRLCGNRKKYEINHAALQNIQAYKKIYEGIDE